MQYQHTAATIDILIFATVVFILIFFSKQFKYSIHNDDLEFGLCMNKRNKYNETDRSELSLNHQAHLPTNEKNYSLKQPLQS